MPTDKSGTHSVYKNNPEQRNLWIILYIRYIFYSPWMR